LSLADLSTRIREEKLIKNLTTEEEGNLLEKLEASKASKELGKCLTPKQRVADASRSLQGVEEEVRNILHELW